jgi:hypothetical protein
MVSSQICGLVGSNSATAEKHTRVAYARTGLVLGRVWSAAVAHFFLCFRPAAGGKDWWPGSACDEARALAFLIENLRWSTSLLPSLQRLEPHESTGEADASPYWFPAPGALSSYWGKRVVNTSFQSKISPEVLLSSGFTFLDSDVSGLHSALR